MKSREKHGPGKITLGKSKVDTHSKAHIGSHTESLSVSHGHTKDVSQSHLLEGVASSRPLSKTHALLQESIAATAAEKSSKSSVLISTTHTCSNSKTAAILADEAAFSATSTHIDSSAKEKELISGVKHTEGKKRHKKRKMMKRELYSSSENEELDVVTPDNTSLSISFRRDLMSECGSASQMMYQQASDAKDDHLSQVHADDAKHDQPSQTHQRTSCGKIRLSAEDLASDVSDVDEVIDTIKPPVLTDNKPLWIRINRDLISTVSSSIAREDCVKYGYHTLTDEHGQLQHQNNSDSSLVSPSYAVEYNPTKMVITSQPLPTSDVEDQDFTGVEAGNEFNWDMGEAGTVVRSSVKKAKKKKKKAKHKKIVMGKDLKLKITME